MNNNKNKKTGLLNATSLGLAMVAFSFAAQAFTPVIAPVKAQEQDMTARDQGPMTFSQRVMSGMLNMMSPEEKMKVEKKDWIKYLPAIISHEEYDQIPLSVREEKIEPNVYYATVKGEPTAMEMLMTTGQFAAAPQQVRDSVTADYLTKKYPNGYMLLVSAVAKNQWNSLSQKTRDDIAGNHDLWMNPVAFSPAAGGEITEPLVTIAAINGHLDIVPLQVLKTMAPHPSWDNVKRRFMRAALEHRQMNFLERLAESASAFWQSFTDNDLTIRDESGSNLVDRFSEMGQAHLLPEKFWQSLGIKTFTTVNPRTTLTPLYLIASTQGIAKKLTAGQLAVVHQASKQDWMFEDKRIQNAKGVTALFNALYHLQPDLAGDQLWKDITYAELTQIRGDGHPLSFWVGNADAVDRIAHLLSAAEIAALPEPGSVAAKAAAWDDIAAVKADIEQGRIDKTRLMKIGPNKRTLASQIILSIPTMEFSQKFLPTLTFEELTQVEGEKGEFPLMYVADVGLLEYLSPEVYSKIRANPDILTKKAKDGRFILNIAAKDRNNHQLKTLHDKDVLSSLRRESYLVRDHLGGFPSFWAHFTAQEKFLPKGIFLPQDTLAIVQGKGNVLIQVFLREETLRKNGKLKDGEAGPMTQLLEQFPFETWRDLNAAGETGLLELGRNGQFRLMPKGFRDRVTSADLGQKGPHNDSLLFWLEGAFDLVEPAALAGVKSETWTDIVEPAADDDGQVTEQIRNALAKRSFALMDSIKLGILPPPSYEWTELSYTQQDGSGNSVVRELDRQGLLNPVHAGDVARNHLHNFARLGLLSEGTLTQRVGKNGQYVTYTDNAIPSHVLGYFRNPESWLYKPPGALRSIFEEAAQHGQISAAKSVLSSIPVSAWYARAKDGSMPIVAMIHKGLMKQVPANGLYESPEFWNEELLAEVYDAKKWQGSAEDMLNLWTFQTQHILSEKNPKAALYQSFKPRFEENYRQISGKAPATVPTPSP